LLAGAEGLLRTNTAVQAYLRLLDTLAENLKRRTHHLRELEPTALIEQISPMIGPVVTKKA
jgi:hypothetical protein